MTNEPIPDSPPGPAPAAGADTPARLENRPMTLPALIVTTILFAYAIVLFLSTGDLRASSVPYKALWVVWMADVMWSTRHLFRIDTVPLSTKAAVIAAILFATVYASPVIGMLLVFSAWMSACTRDLPRPAPAPARPPVKAMVIAASFAVTAIFLLFDGTSPRPQRILPDRVYEVLWEVFTFLRGKTFESIWFIAFSLFIASLLVIAWRQWAKQALAPRRNPSP